MRNYGKVQSGFWQSRDFDACTDAGRLLALYLLTGPHTNGIGCFRLPDGYIMDDLGWDQETVSKGFFELERNGFAYRIDRVVFIPNFLRWNAIENSNVAKARMEEFEALPTGEAKRRAGVALLEFCSFWTDAHRNRIETVCDTLSRESGTQNRTEPNRTEPEPEPEPKEKTLAHRADARSLIESDFESEFWPVYPRKVDKAKALKAFVKLAPDADLLAKMCAAVRVQAKSVDWLKDGGQFIPHPSTWINGRRWEDDIAAQTSHNGSGSGDAWGNGPSPAALRRLA